MLVPNRHANTPEYRYGFQGQEMDDELKGEGNSLNYTYRMHDPRVGRFFARDPLAPKYPFYSPYQFSGNRVIDMVELEGLEPGVPGTAEGEKRMAFDESLLTDNPGELMRFFVSRQEWTWHAGTSTTKADWKTEANYKQVVLPYAIDLAKAQGYSTGSDWKESKDFYNTIVAAPSEVSAETKHFLSSRVWANQGALDEITKIGISEINKYNAANYFSATGYTEQMDFSSPIFGMGFGLKNLALGTNSITKSGIASVEAHLANPIFDFDFANTVMVHRLKRINEGLLKATIQDLNFYKHELIEQSLMAKGMLYDAAHLKTLEMQGIKFEGGYQKLLYTEDALKAGDGFDMWSKGLNGY